MHLTITCQISSIKRVQIQPDGTLSAYLVIHCVYPMAETISSDEISSAVRGKHVKILTIDWSILWTLQIWNGRIKTSKTPELPGIKGFTPV